MELLIGLGLGIGITVVARWFIKSCIEAMKVNEREKRKKKKQQEDHMVELIRTTVNECLSSNVANENK